MVVGDIGSIELEGSPQSAGQQRKMVQSTPTPMQTGHRALQWLKSG